MTFLGMHITTVGSIKAFHRQIFWKTIPMQVLAANVQIVTDAMCGFVGRVHGSLSLGRIGFV